MPKKMSKQQRYNLMAPLPDIIHAKMIDEGVAQILVTARPKMWLVNARKHVATVNAARRRARDLKELFHENA